MGFILVNLCTSFMIYDKIKLGNSLSLGEIHKNVIFVIHASKFTVLFSRILP